MPKANITKRTVDAAKAGERDQFIWDDDVAGFGLKVTPAGGKTYVFQYRIARPGEAERTSAKRYTIGRHGKLTPDQARKLAKQLAALVEQGIDPRQQELDAIKVKDAAERLAREQKRQESELIFDKIADLWLDHYEHEKERRPASVRQARLVVDNHLRPVLAAKPMPHIGRDDLEPILDAIPARQKAMRRTVYVYAAVLWKWAVGKRYAEHSPLEAMVKPDAPRARDIVLNDSDLADLWAASETINQPFGSFFRLLVLTGQRRSEVAAMRWSELDRRGATWTIPPERAKNGKAHIVPLSAKSVSELDRLAGDANGEDERDWPKKGHVLTTTGHSAISGITKAKNALDAAIAKRRDDTPIGEWRIHDLRRTLATGLQKLGVRFEVTEAVLNHISGAKGGVAGIYQQHDWKDEKRAALDAWANHIEAITSGKDRENVVPIATARKSA